MTDREPSKEALEAADGLIRMKGQYEHSSQTRVRYAACLDAIAQQARDAALEEAGLRIDKFGSGVAVTIGEAVRALKSKPAAGDQG